MDHNSSLVSGPKSNIPLSFTTRYSALKSQASHLAPGWQTHLPGVYLVAMFVI